MTAVALLLIDAALRASALLLAALVVTRLLARRSAALRHAVWTATVAGTLVLPVASAVTPDRLRLAVDGAAVWAGVTRWTHAGPAAPRHAAPRAAGPARAPDMGGAAPAATADPTADALGTLAAALVAVWGVGAALAVLGTYTGLRAAARLADRAAPAQTTPGAAWLAQLTGELAAARGRRPPAVRLGAELAAPATVGVWRPAIVLPADAPAWPVEHARGVLAHEVAHVVRRDGLTQLLARLARAAYWFHPLAWVAVRRMATEREHACDDQALGAGLARHAYAALLVRVARGAHAGLPPAGALAMARPAGLEARVLAVLDPHAARGTTGRGARLTIAGAAAAAVALAAAPRVGAARAQTAGAARSAWHPPSPRPRRGEPDTRGDSVAGPLSERLGTADLARAAASADAAADGPDSALVRALRMALARSPAWDGDLVRERAAWALGRARRDRLVEPLVAALGDADWRARAYAAWALGQSRDPRAAPPLVAQLGHPVWRLRAMAAYALAELGDPAARPAMEARAGDEAWQVRASVVRYLGAFGDAPARALVRRASSDPHVMVRAAAEQAAAGPSAR